MCEVLLLLFFYLVYFEGVLNIYSAYFKIERFGIIDSGTIRLQ